MGVERSKGYESCMAYTCRAHSLAMTNGLFFAFQSATPQRWGELVANIILENQW